MPSVQAKIVGDYCNLRCSYCRDRDFDQINKQVMSSEVLRALILSMAKLPQRTLRMHWLGGEPTLAGLSLFREAVEIQHQSLDRKWRNTIQTNAILIDNTWAKFLKQNDFKVGVSVDGSPRIHDRSRKDLAQRGSYGRTMNGVHILRQYQIYPSVICVVTRDNMHNGAEMLNSLVEAGFTNIAFNPFYNTATNMNSDPFAVGDAEWLQFLGDMFEEWVRIDRRDIRVREIDDILAWTQGKVAKSCVFRGSCSTWLLVDYNGKIYPCERLGRAVCFGDILSTGSFEDVFRRAIYQDFANRTTQIPDKCRTCQIQDFCHNGCVVYRIDQDLGHPRYAFCGSRILFGEYLSKRVRELAGTTALTASSLGEAAVNFVPISWGGSHASS